MKAWVDKSGVRTAMHTWSPAHEPQPLDVDHWLRERRTDDFDDEFTGLLATPPPALDELGRSLSAEYEFLRELTPDEQKLASCHGRDRTLLLRMLAKLPGTNMPLGSCW